MSKNVAIPQSSHENQEDSDNPLKETSHFGASHRIQAWLEDFENMCSTPTWTCTPWHRLQTCLASIILKPKKSTKIAQPFLKHCYQSATQGLVLVLFLLHLQLPSSIVTVVTPASARFAARRAEAKSLAVMWILARLPARTAPEMNRLRRFFADQSIHFSTKEPYHPTFQGAKLPYLGLSEYISPSARLSCRLREAFPNTAFTSPVHRSPMTSSHTSYVFSD